MFLSNSILLLLSPLYTTHLHQRRLIMMDRSLVMVVQFHQTIEKIMDPRRIRFRLPSLLGMMMTFYHQKTLLSHLLMPPQIVQSQHDGDNVTINSGNGSLSSPFINTYKVNRLRWISDKRALSAFYSPPVTTLSQSHNITSRSSNTPRLQQRHSSPIQIQ